MHYATRCPNCRTAFRVKADQLAAMSGRVRCGRCAYVFNALEHLLPPADGPRTELPAEIAPETAYGEARTIIASENKLEIKPKEAPEKIISSGGADTHAAYSELSKKILSIEEEALKDIDLASAALGAADNASTPSESNPQTAEVHNEDVLVEEAPPVVTPPPNVPQRPAINTPTGPIAVIVDTQSAPPLASPTSVVGVVDESPNPDLDLSALLEYGQRKRFSWTWFLLALITCFVLIAQCVWIWREPLLKSWPASKQIWTTLCPKLTCEVPLVKDATALAVDNVTLEEKSRQPKTVILSLELRNGADYAVAYPMLALTLTDTNNQPVAKKVLSPTDYLNPKDKKQTTLPGGSGLTLKVPLALDEINPAGYAVEAYY
ncbi:DUF3426 domain-containing protein [Leeia sp. TBRC 13508]|uniref:DUF3426 domain-containing protein n=1 Tax=Leeia speluncae TaxID=2884804 RepID=A0ABS8D5L5_9NEIS|nr:DUF3426 domain-containing protein [Leeia speluncae]MCB6183417.1 DUF3426 domain-containing protein [Leeia speluncae]